MGCSQSTPVVVAEKDASAAAVVSSNSSTASAAARRSSRQQRPQQSQRQTQAAASPPRPRMDSWGAPIAQSTNNDPQKAQWTFLWQTFSPFIVDPADVPAVLDALMANTVNKLDPPTIQRLLYKLRLRQKQQTKQSRSLFSAAANAPSTLTESVQTIDYYKQRLLVCSCTPSAATLLLHLSTSSCFEKTADMAVASAQGLELNVNKQAKQPPTMPKPSACRVTESASITTPDPTTSPVSFSAVCCLLAIGLAGTRAQRLQWLFYVLLEPEELVEVLQGGVPTWLLEVHDDASPVIVSCASLAHYHYCHGGTPLFWPSPTLTATAASASENKNVVSSKKPLQISMVRLKELMAAVNVVEEVSNHNTSTVSPVLERLWTEDAGPPVEIPALSQYNDDDTKLSIQEFANFAQEHIPDEQLDALMHRLLGVGIVPTPRMEKNLVQERWLEWQDECRFLQQQHDDDDDEAVAVHAEEAAFEIVTKQVLSMNGDTHHETRNGGSSTRRMTNRRVWGGLGGIDGGGGIGHGVLYCIDKQWWDAWVDYVGWTWVGDAPRPPQRRRRPGALSTERLLDRDCEGVGTLGSYEVMKNGLKKDEDYVCVPPGVWDVLYEIYAGGPPLPRMIKSAEQKFSESDRLCSSLSTSSNSNHRGVPVDLDDFMESLDQSGGHRVMRIPENLHVAVHPWVFCVHFCDPLQPYRRGDTGTMTIRVQATPDQPLWRLFAEIISRFPLHAYKTAGSDNRGKARLWKKTDRNGQKDPVSRYGPWNLLCKSRHAVFPLPNDEKELAENVDEFIENWKEYSDDSTVEGIGLTDSDHIMLEFATINKNGDLAWPREAAAKAGRVRRLAEEDMEFRRTLQGVDEKGSMLLKPISLVGMEVDAMDSTGRWYPATILEVEIVDEDTENGEIENENGPSRGGNQPMSTKKVRIDFSAHGGHEEWIDVESDRLAVAGRFTNEAERHASTNETKSTASQATSSSDTKPKPTAPVKKNSTENVAESGKICLWPGYGACGLTNLGNTCYINSAIQCLGYMPLLRSYLLSAQYKTAGDLNRDNPLGTGGKLLEEFAELMRVLWGGKTGEKSPTRFRSQLGKINSQFSGADQQDAQEFLNHIVDVLHEDSNRVRKKPYVEALEDDWVAKSPLPRVGDESWRRFLRRNRSIITDIAMGQVLNTVTCPVCNFSSRNFDPFNLLSIPIPRVADVIFKCTVYRRSTALNCPWVLNKPRRGEKHTTRYVRRVSSSPTGPPSESNVAEQYVIAMSRLADSGDLRLQIQNACGIPANQLRLCRLEEVIVRDENGETSAVAKQMKVVPLTDKEGPCSQLSRKFAQEEGSMQVTTIIAFESTLRPRLMPPKDDKEDEVLDDTADEDEDGEVEAANLTLSLKEQDEIRRYLSVYGDGDECRLVDTNPLMLAKAVSRSIWPRMEDELKLGLRVDARDHRGNWFPGNVVEIIDTEANGGDADTGDSVPIRSKRVRVHFDNFSSKWDELYSIDHFERGSVRPLYSHSSPRPKPTEFIVHHRHIDRSTGMSYLFGQSFYVHCQNEWTNARAGAHILAQASKFLKQESSWGEKVSFDDPVASVREAKARRLYEKTQANISDLIDLLIDCDREYIQRALGVTKESRFEDKGVPFRNPGFDSTSLSDKLADKISVLLNRLPFEVRVCTVATSDNDKSSSTPLDEVPFPFSLIRTIGNYINARHAVLLQWREPPIDKKAGTSKSYLDAPVMYIEPKIEVDRASLEILKSKSNSTRENGKTETGGSGGIDIGVCLTEFCKQQALTLSDNWKCPHCKKFREGRQSMKLWRLPDLLTFHIKRFNMSARWREKITTKVNFPLTGLDLSSWCHNDSPTIQLESGDSHVYDLIGVVNHYGSMTGGHYVATCRATPCGRDGKEEVVYNFNGVGASMVESGDADEPSGWRIGRQKSELSQNKMSAALSSRAATESAEPLWLQFDDELVEPIPPHHVVSEMAYVLFYRRRRMTPSNIAKYSTLE